MLSNGRCHYIEIVILKCSFCLFKLSFNQVMCSASFNFDPKEEDAEFMIVKHFSLHKLMQDVFSNKYLKIWDFLSVTKCSVGKWHLVSPI